mmetsp:Transcript_16928/g.39899  ORF Transcript_16928/g.39899 Transcript_16928/m.39899 type:complete len:208 (+) Transcript_16928:91-714(+)
MASVGAHASSSEQVRFLRLGSCLFLRWRFGLVLSLGRFWCFRRRLHLRSLEGWHLDIWHLEVRQLERWNFHVRELDVRNLDAWKVWKLDVGRLDIRERHLRGWSLGKLSRGLLLHFLEFRLQLCTRLGRDAGNLFIGLCQQLSAFGCHLLELRGRGSQTDAANWVLLTQAIEKAGQGKHQCTDEREALREAQEAERSLREPCAAGQQ